MGYEPIGPECFGLPELGVVCWRGENYYRIPESAWLAKAFQWWSKRHPRAARCTSCGEPVTTPPCQRDPITGKGGHTHGGGIGAA